MTGHDKSVSVTGQGLTGGGGGFSGTTIVRYDRKG